MQAESGWLNSWWYKQIESKCAAHASVIVLAYIWFIKLRSYIGSPLGGPNG